MPEKEGGLVITPLLDLGPSLSPGLGSKNPGVFVYPLSCARPEKRAMGGIISDRV